MDTYKHCISSRLHEIKPIPPDYMDKIVLWLKVNKLSLDVKNKSKYMVFHNRHVKLSSEGNAAIFIAGAKLDRVYTHKFLGFIIDPTLKWDSHVKATSTQVAKSAGIICKARKYLNKETLLMLYYAFIYPYIDYGILIWGASFQESLYPIVAMQKRIIRIITCAHKRDHTCNLFKNTGIPTIHS